MLNINAYLWPFLAILGFSLGVIFSKMALNNPGDMDFYSIAIWSWGSAMLGATLVFYLPFKSQREVLIPELKKHRKLFIVISLLTVLNGGTWFYGMSQISGGVVALIDQNVILWTFLLGIIFLGERFYWTEMLGITVVLIGLFVISSLQGEVTFLGVINLLICGFSIALQSVIMKLYKKNFNPLALTFWRGWGMVFGSFVICYSLGLFDFFVTKEVLAWGFAGQFFGLFIARAAYIKGHEFFPISQLSLMTLMVPVVVLAASAVFLGEPLSAKKLVGAALMISGLAWFLFEKQRLKNTRKNLSN